jgi:hypothetical protein
MFLVLVAVDEIRDGKMDGLSDSMTLQLYNFMQDPTTEISGFHASDYNTT